MADIKDSLVFAVKLDRNKISDFVNEIIGKITDVVKSIDVESINLYKVGYEKGKEDGCREFVEKLKEYSYEVDGYNASSRVVDVESMDDALAEMGERINERKETV